MKTINSKTNINLTLLIADIGFSSALALLFTAMLLTGVVYPIKPAEQKLLQRWGIEPFFINFMWILYLVPLIVAIPVMFKLIKKYERLKTITFMMVSVIAIVDVYLSFQGTALVIKNMVVYPLIGWYIGQTIAKALAMQTEKNRKNK